MKVRPLSNTSGPCLAVSALLAMVIIAGCAGRPNNDGATPSGLPSGTQVPPSPTPTGSTQTTQPPPAPVPLGANFTDCAGVSVPIIVPAELVRDDVPENYTLYTGTPNSETAAGDVSIVLDMIACQKIAIDGKDEGPATISSLYVSIKTPAGAAVSNPLSWYLLEMTTDHAGLTDWLSSKGAKVAAGGVEYTSSPQGPSPAPTDLRGTLVADGSVVYSVQGYPSQEEIEKQNAYYLYYGENPEADFWETRLMWSTSSDWPGARLEIAEASRLAGVLGASGTIPTFIASMIHAAQTLTPADASA